MTDSGTEEARRIGEERYRSLILAIAEIVWTTALSGLVIEDQPGWRAYTGQTSEEIKGAGWLTAVHPDSRDEAASDWARAVSRNSPFETEWRLRRRDGEYRYFSIRAAPVRANNGAASEWIGCSIDITDCKQREEESSRLHADAGAALARLERQGREMQILKNLSETQQACNSREEAYPFIAMAASELFSGASGALAVPAAGARELLETVIEWGGNDPLNKGGWMKTDFGIEDCWALRRGRMHEPGAGTVCHHFRTEPIKTESGGPYACVPLAVRGDVSGLLSIRLAERRRLDEEGRSMLSMFGNAVALGLSTLHLRETLQKHALRDPLTGLASAEFSEAVLAREIRRAERHRESVSLAVLDLDGCTKLEEAQGPRAAEALLLEVGTLLRNSLGPLDLAARSDSQKFLLVLAGDDPDSQEASAPLPRLRAICLDIQRKARTYQDAGLPAVTVCAGLAEWPAHGTTADELVRAANQALRVAKLGGPGSIEVFSAPGMPAPGAARDALDRDKSDAATAATLTPRSARV